MRSETDPDAGLRERFGALRERDRAAAPAFERMITPPASRIRSSRSRLAWTAGGFALASVVGALLLLRPPPPLDAAVATLPAWPTQTAFLLADAGESSRRLAWTPSPTSGLGQPTFTRIEEKR